MKFSITSAILTFTSICILLAFPGWRVDDEIGAEVKPIPSLPLVQILMAITLLADMFSIVSALWQHTSAATAATIVEASTLGFVRASIGTRAVVLAWLHSVFLLLATLMVQFTLSSLRLYYTLAE